MRFASGRQRLAARWVDRSLRAKGLVVIAVPVAILVLVLATTLWFTHADDRAQSIAGQARELVDSATTLESSLLSAQAGIGSYLLTGDADFATAYSRAAAVIPGQLDQLASSADTADGGTSSAAIVRDAHRLVFDMSQLALQRPSRAPASVVRALLRFSQSETQRLRADVAAFSARQSAVIASQHSAIRSSGDLLPAIAIAAVVLALAGGVLVSQLFTTGVVTRLRRLERATEAIERGEVPEGAPTGGDEIGRLSARLLDTATQLRERAVERDRARTELENILTASPVVSLCYDVASRRFSYASPNIERLLGMSAEQAIADPAAVMRRFHPDSRHTLGAMLVGGAGQHGDRFQLLLRFRRDPDADEWREAEAVYTVETDAAGALVSVVAYVVDVSERYEALRAAEHRRLLLESIFHASPDTIVVRDMTGRVVIASSALAEVIGAGAPARAGQGGAAPADRRVLEDLIARCLAGERGATPVVTTGRLPSGEIRTFETRARPVLDRDGQVTGTVTVSRDVTDRVRLEHSLRHASSAAERASDAKSEFLSRMSHELRTPLNAILGFAQLLELDALPGEQRMSVEQILIAGRHLLALINEVLDISRIEAGRVSLSTEPVEVRDLLEEVATLLAPVAEAAKVELAVDVEGARGRYVRADRQRLLQVLLNLGSNAVKYNHRGGSVSFQTEPADTGRVRFEVRDSGPGIPYEQQDQLFVPFARLGAERSAIEGTGVGLALSKQLVEVMAGAIGVESVPGHGSTFWVELLACDPPAPSGTEPAGAPGREGGTPPLAGLAGAPADHVDAGEGPAVTVLHVEDNPSNASLVEQVLSKRPCVRLVSAAEGRSGLELARRHHPDLVLLDLHLPDLPGDELLHRLKTLPELADTKVVVVSADATPSRIRGMLDLGVEGYLTKPVDVEALLRLVDHEIGVKQGATR